MRRVVAITLAAVVLMVGLALVVQACAPYGHSGPQESGVEIDIDMPKQHKKPPTYKAPTYKAPTYKAPTYKAPAPKPPTYKAPAPKPPTYKAPAPKPPKIGKR